MAEPVLAAQLYTVRQFTQTPKDIAQTLKKVRDIGYRSVQVSAFGPIAPQDLKALLDENGLGVCITHTAPDRLWNDLPAVIAEHKLWGCPNVAIGMMPKPYRDAGEEGFHKFATDANEIGRKLHEAGLTFSYHNHRFEFERFGAKLGMDIIYGETDPRYVMAELDTYWVQYGGCDPVQWIKRMKRRMPVVHFKDMAIKADAPIMAEVGEGNLNWPAIIDACRAAGVRWYAVEQDICPGDPFDSLAISYRNLKAMGLT